MKICMVNPLFYPYLGGTEKHLYEVGKRLAKKHDVTVLTAQWPGTKKEEDVEGIHVVRTSAWIIKKAPHPLPPPFPITVNTFLRIREYAKKSDVVHFHNRFTYSLLDFGVVKSVKKPLCITLHNSRPWGIDPVTDAIGGGYDKLVGERVMEQCDRIAAVSKDTLEQTVPLHMWKKARVIYNGVSLEKYDPSIDVTDTKHRYGKYFLCIARLVEQKGLKYLIDAMKNVDAKLVILGSGPLEKKLKKSANRKVTFVTDRLDEKQLAQLYKGCYGFVLPSLYEPFGMVICEAMAMERPVIGSRIGGIPEIITKDVGLIAEPRSEISLAKQMNYLLDNPQEAEKMGKNGRKRVAKYFTWDLTAEGYEKMYKSLE